MTTEADEVTTTKMGDIKLEDGPGHDARANSRTPKIKDESPGALPDYVKSRSGSAETPNSNAPAKLSRKSSHVKREPPLYGNLPDITDEARDTFQVIPDCLYGSKHLGATDNDSLDCDCQQEWRTCPFVPSTLVLGLLVISGTAN